jgi:hypothetical protein
MMRTKCLPSELGLFDYQPTTCGHRPCDEHLWRCDGGARGVLDQGPPLLRGVYRGKYLHPGSLRSSRVAFVLIAAFSLPVAPGRAFVPDKHVVQSHEHDLPCGLGDRIALTVYVHLLPVEILDSILDK